MKGERDVCDREICLGDVLVICFQSFAFKANFFGEKFWLTCDWPHLVFWTSCSRFGMLSFNLVLTELNIAISIA